LDYKKLPGQPHLESKLFLSIIELASISISCFSVVLAGALLLKFFVEKFGFIDQPNDRSSHNNPTPKGRGVGFLVAFGFMSAI
jgi:UDP-N-acetylmuramyl pentapeptide phosphotransferase/UDP-N-acetylglucosamine-1-phosphate transferase